MKRNFMGMGFLALFIVMAASMIAAPVTCDSLVTGGANVTALNNGGSGCIEGGLLFNNFAVINGSSGTGTAEIDVIAGGITFSNGDIVFSLNPNLGAGTIGNTITDLHFAYTIQGTILGASMSVGGNGASINEQDCRTPTGLNDGCLNANTAWNTLDMSGQATTCVGNTGGGTGTNSICNFGTGVSPEVWVYKDISITSPTMSHLTGFTEDFIVPEPVTTSLVGLGLLGIGLLGRRMKKS